LLTGNDSAQGPLFILYNADGSLNSPSQSSYAEMRKPESGEVNYIYHQGFTLKDSFQYIASDLITNDTAWVFINNAPCVAEDDMLALQQDPLASSSYYEVIDVLANDTDPEDIMDIVPFDTDTLDTSNGRVVIKKTEAGVWLNYFYKRHFFYKDSFVYTLTDVPASYAANDFFTQDDAWVYIEDTAYLIDSDGDGIVNTMEDNKIGYQLYEDTLDFDKDGIPNYLDNDANGFPAAGDCDGDGILNSLDAAPGCDDIQVSTAFTPNGDNVNDFFVIPEIVLSDNSVMQASIKIYNRMGALVYENNNYGQNGDWWDGKLGNVQGVAVGDELPNGVYLYYLIYNDGLSQKESYIHIQR
jgi:gliding motility-associated-like protein